VNREQQDQTARTAKSQRTLNREQQRTKIADPPNHNDQNFTMRDLAGPNGNEKRQPEEAKGQFFVLSFQFLVTNHEDWRRMRGQKEKNKGAGEGEQRE